MSTHRVWKAGKDTLVITIPMNTRKAYEIKENDYIEITGEIRKIPKILPNTPETKEKEVETTKLVYK